MHLRAQRLTEGVSTRQAVGRVSALVVSILKPMTSPEPRIWQRHWGWLETRLANAGQQPLSGTLTVLPASTYVKQSVIFRYASMHGSAGAAAGSKYGAPAGDRTGTVAGGGSTGSMAGAGTGLAAGDGASSGAEEKNWAFEVNISEREIRENRASECNLMAIGDG